jgi:hypothetical protein
MSPTRKSRTIVPDQAQDSQRVVMHTIDRKLERRHLEAAGLLEEWDKLFELGQKNAELEAFSLIAAFLPPHASRHRIGLSYYKINGSRGEDMTVVQCSKDDLPERLRIAVTTLVSPKVPPEAALKTDLPYYVGSAMASVTTADISQHGRIEAERKCALLGKIWDVRMAAHKVV